MDFKQINYRLLAVKNGWTGSAGLTESESHANYN